MRLELSPVAGVTLLSLLGSAQQQEARMINLSLDFLGLRLLLQIDPETEVLILILARLIQRLS